MTKEYDLLCLIPAKLEEKAVTETVETIAGLLKKAGAEIKKDELLGRKKMSYPIKGIRHGIYMCYQFDLDPTKLDELGKELKLVKELCRYQIVAVDHRLEKTAERLEKVRKQLEEEKAKRMAAREEKEKKTSKRSTTPRPEFKTKDIEDKKPVVESKPTAISKETSKVEESTKTEVKETKVNKIEEVKEEQEAVKQEQVKEKETISTETTVDEKKKEEPAVKPKPVKVEAKKSKIGTKTAEIDTDALDKKLDEILDDDFEV